jgi:hypothetical protein
MHPNSTLPVLILAALTAWAWVGMVGLALARAGAHVWLTDGSQQVLSLLERNVAANASILPQRPRVRLLCWGHRSDLDELTAELGHSKHSDTGVLEGSKHL